MMLSPQRNSKLWHHKNNTKKRDTNYYYHDYDYDYDYDYYYYYYYYNTESHKHKNFYLLASSKYAMDVPQACSTNLI